LKNKVLDTEINGDIIREIVPTLQGNYFDFFDGVYHSIVNDSKEPAQSQTRGLHVMQIIEAALQSNAKKSN
jgi:hypothetical protein